MKYRLDQAELFSVLEGWNRYLKKKIHLIACGGTAMTLLGVKESTKDVDFMVPDIREYNYLIGVLKKLGYQPVTSAGWQRSGEIFQFDLFRENRIHTTELFESPLIEGHNSLIKEYSKLYIGVLNDYDLISSKLLRGTRVDFEDCLVLAKAHVGTLDVEKLIKHYNELVLYDVGEERLKSNINHFVELLKEKGIYG